MKKLYLTTTLPYVNADPHIGFALEIIQADVVARFYREQGYDVIFNTGTDEHGQKIYEKAKESGQDPQSYTDHYAARFDGLKDALNLSYTHFIRTTDQHHKEAAQAFWLKCFANGDIYKKNYKVKYCVGCELEKQDSELEEGKCPIHPTYELELRDEDNYFFAFSKYQEPLLKLYKDQPDFVVPDHRMNEIRSFVEGGLHDFSISRLKDKMPWGVEVPNDPEHVMYVWFDALVNYISTLGWPNQDSDFADYWPGIQFAGKDNLRQQSAMWQSMLMSAGIAPSKQIYIHGFITSEGKKMSKSVGNVVNPFDIVQKYGTDPLRYYLLREIPFGQDGDFSLTRFEERYRTELANDLGNLASRVAAMVASNLEGKVKSVELTDYATHIQEIEQFTKEFRFDKALDRIWTIVTDANRYVEQQKPWELAKNDIIKLEEVLAHLVAMVRLTANMLQPYLPETATKLLDQFNAETIVKGEILFPRLDS